MITSLRHTALAERLGPLLERGEREARCRGEAVLVSATAPAPLLDPVALFAAAGDRRALWLQPDRAFALAASGVAERIEAMGADRFASAAAARRDLLDHTIAAPDDPAPLPAPVCIGGFAFDPLRPASAAWTDFADASLVVPRLLYTRDGDRAWITVNVMMVAGDDPDDLAGEAGHWLGGAGEAANPAIRHCSTDSIDGQGAACGDDRSRWPAGVETALARIAAGGVEKVVLAREVRLPLPPGVSAEVALGRLRDAYPACTVFAFARGDRCFLGATPERLVRLDGDRVRATCLAGSAARGATPEEDGALGRELLASAKERHEHAVVARALREALAPACETLSMPETPVLMKMANVQHLHTPIEGRLADHAELLDLVEALHPTPATGGTPRDQALALIREIEPFSRGWYAGPVGWIDGGGSGDFAVAIRSALLLPAEARLYAGCGIVADSDPDREFEESRLKLRPLMSALGCRA